MKTIEGYFREVAGDYRWVDLDPPPPGQGGCRAALKQTMSQMTDFRPGARARSAESEIKKTQNEVFRTAWAVFLSNTLKFWRPAAKEKLGGVLGSPKNQFGTP